MFIDSFKQLNMSPVLPKKAHKKYSISSQDIGAKKEIGSIRMCECGGKRKEKSN